MNTAISIRLPEVLADQIDSIAKETERPRSYTIQKALESYIEDYFFKKLSSPLSKIPLNYGGDGGGLRWG